MERKYALIAINRAFAIKNVIARRIDNTSPRKTVVVRVTRNNPGRGQNIIIFVSIMTAHLRYEANVLFFLINQK